jgi:type IV secretory pathway VirB10-like protein
MNNTNRVNKQYNPLEHTLKRIFNIQNLLLKRSCLYIDNKPPVVAVVPPSTSVPIPPIQQQTNTKSITKPPPPPPPPVPQTKKPIIISSTAPPPPPPPNKQRLVRPKKPQQQTTQSGPLLDFADLLRKQKAMRAKQVNNLMRTDPVVKALLKDKNKSEINDIRKRLVDEREGIDNEEVRDVIRYKQTLARLRQNARLKNKPEPYLMNNLRKYLTTNNNKNGVVNDKAIDNALHTLNVEKRIHRLVGSNITQGELVSLAKKMRNRKVNDITINDISNAL